MDKYTNMNKFCWYCSDKRIRIFSSHEIKSKRWSALCALTQNKIRKSFFTIEKRIHWGKSCDYPIELRGLRKSSRRIIFYIYLAWR